MSQRIDSKGKRPRARTRKRFSPQGRKGDQGIAFIHGMASAMGFVWIENKGYADVGIDGFLELAEPTTGEALNRRLLVQSKAGPSYFNSETDSTFKFHCDQRDLDYWLSGDAPVILVVSRYGTEGYWVSIKDYFVSAERRASRQITFEKASTKFDVSCQARLLELGTTGTGLFLEPVPKEETLFTNLIPIGLNFESIFVGTTHIDSEAEFDRNLAPYFEAPAWAVHEGLVTSAVDLRGSMFRDVLDAGSVEEWTTLDASSEPDLQGRMVHLLNRLIRECLSPFRIRFHQLREFYYFQGNYRGGVLQPRSLRYTSYKQVTTAEVVTNIANSNRPEVACWRHSSAELKLRFYGETWYVAIVPTYFFTADGSRRHSMSAERLKKKKSMEHNLAVRGQARMWCDLLQYNQPSLLELPSLLRFSDQCRVTLSCGLIDDDWLPPPPDIVDHGDDQGLLF